MKKFLRLTAALMAVFAMTNFIACSDGGSSSDDDLTITAESDVKEVEVGKTIELNVVGTDADVTWTSSDTAIATVADGTVTGVKAGEVTITAKAPDGKTGTIKITVKAASSSDDSGSTGGSGSGDSGSTGGSGSGDSGSTGGSGSGDSGSTGGSGSGDSGETPSEGDSFANTYWILDGDFPFYESSDSEGTTVTGVIKDVQYIYLEDAASGKTYDIDYNAAEAAVQELVNAGTNGSRDIAYTTEPDAFTYSVEGSEVTITFKYLDETGVEQTETQKATISEDKTSFSQKQTDDEGNEHTVVYKKAAAAPQNAVLTVTVTKAEDPGTGVEVKHVLNANDLTTFAAAEKSDGAEESLPSEGYFTAIWSAKSKVDSSSKTFSDGFVGTQRINLGGAMLKTKQALKFTTTKAASVKIWWVEGGDDNRQIGIADASAYSGTEKNTVAKTNETLAKNAACISTLEIPSAGTWILGGVENNNYIFKIEVTE